MNKLCIVIPYFGKQWPDYFRFYCDSLKNNPFLDVLLFTDIEQKIPVHSANLIVKKLSAPQLETLILEKTGIRANLNNIRKLCDFKPLYGHVFEDHLIEYKFWGYGDIDVIYGNLSKFLSHEVLKHDIITFREDWISGAFTLVANHSTGKLLYRQSKDHLSLLEKENYTGFDECCNKFGKLRDREDILAMTDDYRCWSFVCYQAQQEGKIKIFAREYIKESLPFDEILSYTKNSVLGSGHKHYALYHHISHKYSRGYYMPAWDDIPKEYEITTTGIYSKDQMGLYFGVVSKIRKAKSFFYQSKKRLNDFLSFRIRKLQRRDEPQ